MKLINTQNALEKIITNYRDLIGVEASRLKNECSIESSEKTIEAIKTLEQEDRLLKIGVVGRVKAGKSSLINALFFDGKSVLPKAATPMTAALTIVSYGDSLSAEVDFFSQSDIRNIKIEHNKYEAQLKKNRKKKKLFFERKGFQKKCGEMSNI